MDIKALVQLPLQVRERDHDRQILPHILAPQLQRPSHDLWRTKLSARYLSSLDLEHQLSLECIEVLRESAAVGFQEVFVDDQGEEGVEFVEGVEDTEEIARVSMGRKSEEVA